ncbi:protein tlpB [Nemorincola caseinilytica]|uniref:Protein tlpB n=1 Tax=Nemorincola caseinilytica TaxID=2054315 RepID=A0ABP8NIQ7_9BACT
MDNGIQAATRGASFYVRRVIGAILLLALSATFFYSAYTKIYSENAFDNFHWTFIDLGISNILVAGIIARMMIGMELLLGLLLLGHVYLRSFTYKAVIAVLSVFIIYLLVIIAKQGNTGNCGCFGDKLAMTPLTAIWKNVAMIVATVALMFIYPVRPYRHQAYVCMALAFLAFSTPFVTHNIYVGTAPVKYGQKLDLDLLYKYSPAPPMDLRKGKHIIAFMHFTCPHCKKAAFLLHIIHRQYPQIPIYMVLDGADVHKKAFFDESQAENVPHLLYPHSTEFLQLAGEAVPAIYWVNNGVAEYKSKYAYYQLDPSDMLSWLQAK